jgi:ribonuclease R
MKRPRIKSNAKSRAGVDGPKGPARVKSKRVAVGVPDKDTLLKFIAEAREQVGPREISKAFGIKGDERRALKALLNELTEEGLISSTGKKQVAAADTPPEGGLFEVFEQDVDGELMARAIGRDGPYGPLVRMGPANTRVRQEGPPPGLGDRFIGKSRPDPQGEGYEVSVIKKLGASAHKIFGVFRAAEHRLGKGGRVIPADRKTRYDVVIFPEHMGKAEDGDLVAIKLLPHRGVGPKRGEILEVFGNSSDPKAASILAIAAHNVPMGFAQDEIEQAEQALPATLSKRTDLRSTPLVTIDPEDARDHDDAVFAQSLPDGGHRIIVAIADVAHYVTPGSALDLGALKRGNSVYFPDRVVPMLPERLSADLCSLIEHADRPCLALEIIIDRQGHKKSHRFMRAMMRSAASLTYHQAQSAIDGNPDGTTAPLLDTVLRPLWAAYGALCQARDARAPLEIDSKERKIVLGKDGKVESIALRERFDAHRLIEEMMIQANVCAAETLEEKKSILIYRVHDRPTETKIAALADFLETVNLKWAKGQPATPARFNRILELSRPTENAEIVNEVVLRSQAQAIYDVDNIGHFGLNLLKYAHFTSPIRRYADLIVHRALIAALGLGDDGLKEKDKEKLARVAEAITATERRAMAAEREATDRYVAAFLSERVGAVFDGRITSVNRFGLFVRLIETGGDGLIPIMRLGNEYFHHDEAAHALVGAESGDRWELGAKVQVRLVEATPISGGLLFDMASEPKAGPVPGRKALRGPSRATTPRAGVRRRR